MVISASELTALSEMKDQGNGAAAATISTNPGEGESKSINTELWHACAGPLVTVPPVGSFVVYFPQGHSEQVAASMQKDVEAHIPNYPNLPSKLICLLHNVTLHADAETDEVYAQMTLQPVNTYDKEAFLASDLALKLNKPQTEFFCKTLTASDTSTHGGFSVPRRAAEKIFPPLDFSMQPPAQELQARDLHDNVWTFRHIYRGQPKRHLLTTGWSLFVSGKRLFAGDSVLFIRDDKGQLLLGIRRANRQPTNISSSVLSSDSMHIGILAAAAHAAANHSPFTIFYNPRASPSEFVIPLAKYNKAIYSNQISLGMRFRLMFETEDSGTRRYMGTITGISDLDPLRWKGSQWRNLQVGWDESAAGERRNRVSIWEIEPVAAPFFICPPPFFRSKRPRQPGMPDDGSSDLENLFKRAVPWLGEEICIKDSQSQNAALPGLSLVQWMNMQQSPSLSNSNMQHDYLRSLIGPAIQNLGAADLSRQLGLQAQILQQNNMQYNSPRSQQTQHVDQILKQQYNPPRSQQTQHVDQILKQPITLAELGSVTRPQQQLQDINLQQRQHLMNQTFQLNQAQSQFIQPQVPIQNQFQQQQQPMIQTFLPQIPNNQSEQPPVQQRAPQQQQQKPLLPHLQQQQKRMPVQLTNQANQQSQLSEHQIQLFQKLQQQQQAFLLQPALQQPQQVQEQQKPLLEATTQHMSNSHLPHQQDKASQQSAQSTAVSVHASPSSQHRPQEKIAQPQVMLPELPVMGLQSQSSNLLSTTGSSLLSAVGAQSGLTDNLPSCSTSPSTNYCPVLPQPTISKIHRSKFAAEEVSHSAVAVLCPGPPGSLDALASTPNIAKELQKSDTHSKPAIPIPKAQNQGGVAPQTHISTTAQIDYLDTSSATSVCLSQTNGQLQQNFPLYSFNQSSMLFRNAAQDSEQPIDPRNNVLFGVNIESPLGIHLTDPLLAKSIDSAKDYHNHLSSDNMVANFSNSKEAQPELSSSIVSQSFGVPDVAFNSIDSTINGSSFLNTSSWAPQPQFQRMRTYTKVYKRGAVGRSIDIARYSDYDELKQDLARMFSIEGQLEDRQRIGWKLVYVDHEDDVLLVGDDPWEEFVTCVRCIRILSPVEVQQMSLAGDLGNSILPNQTCSSSDGGNAWKDHGDQNSGNPSAGSYDHFE